MPEQESFEALPKRNSEDREEHENESEGDEDEEEEKEQEQLKRVTEELSSELQSFKAPPDEAEPRESNLGTLIVPSSLASVVTDQRADLRASSITEVAGKAESKEPIGPSDKKIIAREAVQAAQKQTENQLQLPVCSTQLYELSPISVTQSLSSVPSPTVPAQRLSPQKVNNVHMPEADKKNSSGGKTFSAKKNSSGGKTLSAVSVARRSASDGYNWRKYGQKQVKSPTGSRSYYRCTHSDCCAKKIECCDHSGHVIEIVYKSQHSHEPLWKTNSNEESKPMASNEPTVKRSVPEQSIRVLNDSDPSHFSKESQQAAPRSDDKKQENSSDLSENGKVILKEDHVDEPEPKRRVKKGDLECLDSHVKPGKKPKLVVHAEVDVGISGDGYRWRKYGQKMVKGNPHPRNYYRCTSAGCPVRKQIENAVDNLNAVIITYKGVHDHDMPVPKKRHGPPSAPLVAAAAPASLNNLHSKNTELLQNQKSSTQSSVDTEGEITGEALELGGEKAMESARTLLSIGFEIKPS